MDSLAQSCIIAPSGQIVAQALTTGDELVIARCDLDWCRRYTGTLFDFDRYRRPELYGRITAQRGVAHDDRDRASSTRPCGFTVNGTPVSGAVRPSASAGRAAGGAGHHLAQGRLLAVGPVRLLHRAGRRTGRRRLPDVAGEGGGALGHRPLEGFDAGRAAAVRRRLRRLRRRCSAASASPASSCGRRPRSTRRAPTSPGRTWPATWAPTCAAAPATSRCWTPSRRSPPARSWRRRCRAASGPAAPAYEAGELTLGDRGYVDDMRVPGMLHAALRLTDHARADIHRIDIESARKPPGVVAVLHRGRHPGRSCGSGSSTPTGRS